VVTTTIRLQFDRATTLSTTARRYKNPITIISITVIGSSTSTSSHQVVAING